MCILLYHYWLVVMMIVVIAMVDDGDFVDGYAEVSRYPDTYRSDYQDEARGCLYSYSTVSPHHISVVDALDIFS